MGGVTARAMGKAVQETPREQSGPGREREPDKAAAKGVLPADPRKIPAESGAHRLRMGAESDGAEREATAAARGAVEGIHPVTKTTMQAGRSEGGGADAPSSVYAALRTPGQALDGGTQRWMEARLGAGFGGVRVHTGGVAAESARNVSARAYAVGNDVVFAAGAYRPDTLAGRRLIAHELAHVAQGNGAVVRRQTEKEEQAQQGQPQGGGARQPAPVNDVSDNPEHEIREISKFDVTPGNKRPWNLNKLTTTIVGLLKAEPRAYIRVLGAHPVIQGEDEPQQAAFERAEMVKKALIQWIGPGKFDESRFYTGFATGEIGDPQVIVEVGYEGKVISEGTASAGPRVPNPPRFGPLDPMPQGKTGDDGGDLQSAVGGQWTWHLNRQAKPDKTVQVQLQRGSGAAQSVYQFQINVDTGDVQAMAGGQLQKESDTKTIEVLKKAIKIKASVFIQVLGGISKAKGDASGSITFQVQAGAQVTAIFGPVTVAIQAAPSVTYQAGQPIAVDFGVAPQAGMSQLPDPQKFPPFIGIPILVGTF